jgi:hypothetical protein
LFPLFATSGKFAASVVNTGGKFATVINKLVANLPPVSLIPVVHLDLRISPRIFEKMGYSGDGGKLIHKKKQKQKIS